MRWPRVLTLTAAGLAVVFLGVEILLGIHFAAQSSQPTSTLVAGVAVTALVGAWVLASAALVSRHAPQNWVGPVLGALGLEAVLFGAADIPLTAQPNAVVVALSQGSWMWFYVPVGLLLAIFPDGRPANRAGRVALVGLPAVALLFQVLAAFPDAPYEPPDASVPNAFEGSTAASWGAISLLPVFLGLLITASVSLVQRYRHGDLTTRTQVRWLMLAGLALPLTLLLCWLSYLLLDGPDLVVVGLALLYLGLPTATAVAVLRYDLYDVDDALAATVAYALMATLLLGVFTAVSIAAGIALGRASIAVAVTVTSVVAFALGSVRARVQARLAGWMFPARERALRAIRRLQSQVQAGTASPDEILPVLRQALGDPGLTMEYAGAGSAHAGVGVPVDDSPATPVLLGGTPVGHLRSGPQARHRPPRDVADASALLLEMARLRSDLDAAVSEIEASRERILLAGYDERRRLERDLHDGAQQRLVSLGVHLRLLQRSLGLDDRAISGELDAAVTQVSTALSELRLLAHGIRPSSLDDGLGAALTTLAQTTPVPLTLDIDPGGPDTDLPDAVSTTAYFVAAEAVTNAVRYAHADHIEVRLRRDGVEVTIHVSDDGRGGASPRPGSGLSGLSDRVAAAGGHLRLVSPVGRGTVVEARLPCGS